MKLVCESLEELLNNELFEGMAEKEAALRQKYKDIDEKSFKEIISIGYKNQALAPYIDWCLRTFINSGIMIEDFKPIRNEQSKVEKFLMLFNKPAIKQKLEKKDINQYKSIGEIIEVVSPYIGSTEVMSKNELKSDAKVETFKNFTLYIPRNYEESVALGKGTEWCTAYEGDCSNYNEYTKGGNRPLLIFISNNNPKEKYQLDGYTESFMNRFDRSVNFKKFMEANKDIELWLQKNYTVGYNNIKNPREYKVSSYAALKKLLESGKIISSLYIENWPYENLRGLVLPKELMNLTIFHSYSDRSKLDNFEGFPKKIQGELIIQNCSFENLKGCPYIGGDIIVTNNLLKSLEGCQEEINGDFSCMYNKLKSLKGAPKKINGQFCCSANPLISLDGAPQYIGGNGLVLPENFNKDIAIQYYNSNNINIPEGIHIGHYHHNIVKYTKKWLNNLTVNDNLLIDEKFKYGKLPNVFPDVLNCSLTIDFAETNLKDLSNCSKKINGDFTIEDGYVKKNALLNGPIEIIGDCGIVLCDIYEFKSSIKKVHGDFSCSSNNLRTLNGVPLLIGKSFDCSNNKLINLNGAPTYVGANFDCTNNKQLKRVEIEKYWKSGAVKGTIYSDQRYYPPIKK